MALHALNIATPTAEQPNRAVPPAKGDPRIGAILVRSGTLAPVALEQGLQRQAGGSAPLGRILCDLGAITERDLSDALAEQYGTQHVDPADFVPDTGLIDRLGAEFCLVNGLLPVQRVGTACLILSCRPDRFQMTRPLVERQLGPVRMAVASEDSMRRALLRCRKRHLARRAEVRVDAIHSCRDMPFARIGRYAAGPALALLLAMFLWPTTALSVLTALSLLLLAINTGFAGVLALGYLRAPKAPRHTLSEPDIPLKPVQVSMLVPLFHEREIAQRLVTRLARIDYPPDLLEILLVVEEDDAMTAATLRATRLPHNMRTVIVPRGQVQTKPRALNYALDFCRGHIVGVYDAEDSPDPGQISAVVRQFQRSAPNVACLQGRLDYYNPHANWMARCFTVEYATWFRIMLPGMARLNLVLPLGGTTLFFRKAALVGLGGWDAHNVTEDADLGLRLARQGYRTELLDSTTHEEANCRVWPWVRQRSRWLKGYGITWLVHMRDPVRLWRDLGPRRFVGVQVLLIGAVAGPLLAPFQWAFALLWLGLPHPWAGNLGPGASLALSLILGGSALLHWSVWTLGTLARGDLRLLPWIVSLSLYHMLATLAALKGMGELALRPFFWDKTSHGHLSGPCHESGHDSGHDPQAAPRAATDLP